MKTAFLKMLERTKTSFLFSFNEKYWSHEFETLKIFRARSRRATRATSSKKSKVPIWDALNGKKTPEVLKKFYKRGWHSGRHGTEKIPHLLKLLDVTTNGSFKKMAKMEFSNYFTSVFIK